MADSTTHSAPTCDVDGTCYCPLTDLMDTLSSKYAMQLISIVRSHESMRFGDIANHLPGASSSTITKRLRAFEAAGLITRIQYDEIPPRVEYSLTSEGEDVRRRLEPLLEWVELNEPS